MSLPKKGPLGWSGANTGSESRQDRTPYSIVAEEYGVNIHTVREICGNIGNTVTDHVPFDERLAILRAKMGMANFAPITAVHTKDDEHEEPFELRNCTLCDEFLEDDDPGQDLIHAEDPEETGVLCKRCRQASIRA